MCNASRASITAAVLFIHKLHISVAGSHAFQLPIQTVYALALLVHKYDCWSRQHILRAGRAGRAYTPPHGLLCAFFHRDSCAILNNPTKIF